ncbi:MAG: response regulator [Planctomycetaceae bacterium]|jgi:two-component system, chemotaxis family, sensor kinase CheA|nr:response regulator [Planctomycetaceae bacterium]MBT6486334.1 response regulator [Planctomycetaceae bacterium]MBT6493266.1 response regulator [Planctomycetaceae bacterium]
MDDEILQDFLAESWENLSQLDTEIVALEKDPKNDDLLASIFRTIHTIKGTCGFIGLTRLGAVAHSGENVLGRMREGQLDVTPDAISLVLQVVDVIKELLEGLEATGGEPVRDDSELIARLDKLAESGTVESSADATADGLAMIEAIGTEQAAPLNETEEDADTTGEPEIEPQLAVPEPIETDMGATTITEPIHDADTAQTAETGKTSVADLSIRVNVNVLDSLMNMVGELVLTRNQLLQLARDDDESKYAAPIGHLNRVTTDLQEGVMKTRMQPIGNAWKKLPRLVRDLSQVTGHHIELEMTGAETELDRTVLDAIKDPLTHMVRNSADHGIESPEDRRAAGKPETGRIRLNACHEGGHVIISITDDGRGIDTKRVLAKAVKNGILSEADGAKLSHNEILSLVFHAGLSTAEKVSSVSGRGVGMDVVKTQIERIGGTVDLTSVDGVGSTVRIKIPLTLAIISALVVESGGESFAIPQLGVVELVRLAADDRGRIERIHDKEVFRLRDRLLPLVHLDSAMGLDDDPAEEDCDINIVVVQVGDEQFGLVVSEVFDTEEIVVKPVGMLLKEISLYQGTTILGDGRVIMILDVAGIAKQFGGLSTASDLRDAAADAATDSDGDSAGEYTTQLLFDVAGRTMAVPLSLVARLEEFSQDQIERSGDRLVVQYRGDLLPLLPVEGGGGISDSAEMQPVIVFSEGENSMGLMVDEIRDIREERLIIRMNSKRPGILGTAIINGSATEIIDTQHYVTKADPGWFAASVPRPSRRILIVDGSLFFRQLLATSLEVESYSVISAEDPVEAIELIERGEKFDAVISEIGMSRMNGFEFAAWLRERSDCEYMPIVALSSRGSSADQQNATQSGFDRWLTKFNSQEVMSTLDDLFARVPTQTGATT